MDKVLKRLDKERFLNQKSKAIWMTGLSGSGKTTIALKLESKLQELGYLVQILDGDNIRTGLNNNLGFSNEDRTENIRRISEVSKLFLNSGIITINCFISPTYEIRETAKSIIGEDDFLEIFVNAPFDICEERDVKGLYKKARAGIIKEFTGLDSPFDEPLNPYLQINTHELTLDESVELILNSVLPLISY